MSRIILDLCGGTGSWSAPYREAGYDVRLVTLPDHDVMAYDPPAKVHGVLMAPPCTEFASSGARWWAGKPPHLLTDAVAIVRRCLEIAKLTNPEWWALENPIGRLPRMVPELGKPVFAFDPCDFGDPWTKRTMLWGRFNPPVKSPVQPMIKSPIHYMPPGPDRQRLRSITPAGFARAFFEANP